MHSKRQTTIHDIAALRVHRDGSRISSKNKNRTVKDAQGNIMAVDAGGKFDRLRAVATMTKSPGKGKAREVQEEDEEAEAASMGHLRLLDDDEDEAESADHQTTREGTNDSEQVRKLGPKGNKRGPLKHGGALKRQKYDDDFDFLGMPQSLYPDGEMPTTPPPESDFLKLIHYVTAQRYESQGLMLNLSDQNRQAVREAKRQRKLDGEAQTPDHEGTPSAAEASPKDKRADKRKNFHPTESPANEPRRDLYQAFDGDLLMALGIILEEDIFYHLRTKPLPDVGDNRSEVSRRVHAAEEQESASDEDDNRRTKGGFSKLRREVRRSTRVKQHDRKATQEGNSSDLSNDDA